MRIGFVGTGHIARALIQGLARSAQADERILVSPRGAETARSLSQEFPGVRIASDNQSVVDGADTVVLSVRPADALAVLRALQFAPRHLLVSLVATTPLSVVSSLAGPATVVRAVPVPAARLGRSPTALYPANARAEALFNRVGSAFPVSSERDLSVAWTVTALISPMYALLDAVSGWLMQQGIAGPLAREFTTRHFSGVLDLAIEESAAPFDQLAAAAATRGGLNEQALRQLQEAGVYSAVSGALDAVLARLLTANSAPEHHAEQGKSEDPQWSSKEASPS